MDCDFVCRVLGELKSASILLSCGIWVQVDEGDVCQTKNGVLSIVSDNGRGFGYVVCGKIIAIQGDVGE